MKRIEIIDPLADSRWTALLEEHPGASFFHTRTWLALLKDVYGYSPFVVGLLEGRDVVGGIPFVQVKSPLTGKRWIALPFSDHCRPLFTDSEGSEQEMVTEFLQSCIGHKIPRIEIRWNIQSIAFQHRQQEFLLHRLRLRKSPEEMFHVFKKTQVQQPILKAVREGVTVTRCKSAEQFRDFYSLQLLTRRRLGVPVQPRDFFDSLWTNVLERGFGYASLAYFGATPIAGAVFLEHREVLTYKYAASDYRYRRLSGNDVVLWEAIRDGILQGFKIVDLGRSETSNEGLRKFKLAWGAEEEPLAYAYLGENSLKSKGSWFIELSAMVIRRSPKIVCRLAGEMLYRHFA